MDRNTLQKNRLPRLRKTQCILGQPDLITQYRIVTFNSFLTQKKNVQFAQNFVVGLNFPTTAHFSSFVNQRVREWGKDSKNQTLFRMKLNMYDAFRKIDVQIEINIPGSMEIKAFGINGQPVRFSQKDYQSVYFSSVLRSLWSSYMHNNMQIFGQLSKKQVLKDFIKNFIPFAIGNPLKCGQISSESDNIGIQLLLFYLKQNKLMNLANYANDFLKLEMPQRSYLFSLELKQAKEDYKGIIIQTSSKLMEDISNPELAFQLKKYQLRSLIHLDKKHQAKLMTEILMREGLDDRVTWQAILKYSIANGEDQGFMKFLNTAINFLGEQNRTNQQILRKIIIQPSFYDDKQAKKVKDKKISKHPQYNFKFDQNFMEKQTRLKVYRQILQKSEKQKSTLELLYQLDSSAKRFKHFQQVAFQYEKQKGWNKLLLLRAECFWLENDYNDYQSNIKKKKDDMSYRFMNQKLNENDNLPNVSKISMESEESEGKEANMMNQSFDGDFSDADSEGEEKSKNLQIPLCSKRVATKRVNNRQFVLKKGQPTKILCHYSLEGIFLNLYYDIKLHGDLEKWFSKLNFEGLQQISQQKRQLIAFMCIKKAYFHKKMLRFRKCEQSLKISRKFSSSVAVGLISCYSLAKLYLQHNNVKGVQFYTIQIVKILWTVGIQSYDLLPQWSRQFIPFIIKHYGKGIINRLQGPLNDLVSLWLQLNDDSPEVKS